MAGAAILVVAAMLAVAPPAVAEPMLFAPDAAAPLPSPASPPAVALDCWLLDPDRLERAADRGLCGDAFARAPEIAALPTAPAPPALAVVPPRKPKVPERRIRASSRSESHVTDSHVTGSSPARIGRTGGDGDFFSNFRRDFRALTNLLGSGSSPDRGNGGLSPGSHQSHGH